jgi:predicted membrane channel-forming protein YqfA (hemolysin III family)
MAILTVCMAMVIVFVIGALRRELGAATLVGLFLGGVLFALGTVTP